MDATEKLVSEFLNHSGYCDAVHEPNGSAPPDFVVDNRIAVEVRRLNQNYVAGGTRRSLEEASIPLVFKFRKLLASFGPPRAGRSWFVTYDFQRPLGPWKFLERKVWESLEEFASVPTLVSTEVSITNKFKIEMFPAGKVFDTLFVLGGYIDLDAGGWVIHEMLTNLELCVDEKSRKMASIRNRYEEFWLVLVDHIGFGLTKDDQSELRRHWSIKHDWDKIILIDPRDHTRSFEL